MGILCPSRALKRDFTSDSMDMRKSIKICTLNLGDYDKL